jgi:hypothetical protein
MGVQFNQKLSWDVIVMKWLPLLPKLCDVTFTFMYFVHHSIPLTAIRSNPALTTWLDLILNLARSHSHLARSRPAHTAKAKIENEV